jgi:hypothetical protein
MHFVVEICTTPKKVSETYTLFTVLNAYDEPCSYVQTKWYAVLWDITPRVACKNRHFGEKYRLHYHGDKNRRSN